MPPPRADLAALILAAGAGLRYGGPKALARLGGRTWLELAAERAGEAGFDPVVVVTGAEEERVRAACGRAADAACASPVRWVSNPLWPQGRTGSIQAGLGALAGVGELHQTDTGPSREARGASGGATAGPGGVLIYAVDFPFVSVATLRVLARAFCETQARERAILLPVDHGRRGHPILVGWAIWDEIARLGPDEPLRAVIRRDPARVREIVVADEGIHRNVNTREEAFGPALPGAGPSAGGTAPPGPGAEPSQGESP